MILRRFIFCVCLVPLASHFNGSARADTYALDPQHTEVRFTWDHLGLSRQGGRFTAAEGTVTFNPAIPEVSTIDVTIPVKSISTGVKKLDEHLIGTKDFFDAATYPAITFKSTIVRPKTGKTAEIEGDLSINGVTRPAVLDVVWNFSGEHPLQSINPVYAGAYAASFSAITQIRRSDWGITRTIPYVSDELRITIETEMLRTSETPVTDGTGPAVAPAPGTAEPGSTAEEPSTAGGEPSTAGGEPSPPAQAPIEPELPNSPTSGQ